MTDAACDAVEVTAGRVHVPSTLDEFDIPGNLLEELALKILFLTGQMSLLDLSERMKVCFPVA
jgi:hypothetical protein